MDDTPQEEKTKQMGKGMIIIAWVLIFVMDTTLQQEKLIIQKLLFWSIQELATFLFQNQLL